MQSRFASDQPPVTAADAVPLGTGRLRAALTSTGPDSALSLAHANGSDFLAESEITLDLPPADAWRGELNAEMAIFTEEFNAGDRRFVRETIAHLAKDLVIMRIAAEQPFGGNIGWTGSVTRLPSGNRLAAAGSDASGVSWHGEVRVHLADGDLAVTEDHRLAFRDTHEIVCEFNLGYGANGQAGAECSRHRIGEAEGWDQLVQQHVDLWRQHFGGLVGTIPGQDPAPMIPQRRELLAAGRKDPRLYFALWQACRYRLCSAFATAPPQPLGPIAAWLGLIPSGLPAYLSRQLADGGPNAELAQRQYDAYLPTANHTTQRPIPVDQIAAEIPDSPAAAVWHAANNRQPDELTQSLDKLLTSQVNSWLSISGADALQQASLIAAAFPAMLVQSEDEALRLCPSLPTSWPQGAAHGLLAPGGWTLSLEWSLSRITKVVIAGNPAGNCELRNLPDEYTLVDDHENAVPFTQTNDCIAFAARPRQAYFLQRHKIRD